MTAKASPTLFWNWRPFCWDVCMHSFRYPFAEFFQKDWNKKWKLDNFLTHKNNTSGVKKTYFEYQNLAFKIISLTKYLNYFSKELTFHIALQAQDIISYHNIVFLFDGDIRMKFYMPITTCLKCSLTCIFCNPPFKTMNVP